jgi:hypothetical protein
MYIDVMALAVMLDIENEESNIDDDTTMAPVRRNSFSVNSISIKTASPLIPACSSADNSSAKEGTLSGSDPPPRSGLGYGLRRLLSSSSINLPLFSMMRKNATTVEEIEGGKKGRVVLMSEQKSLKGNQREFLERFKATQMYAEFIPQATLLAEI